MTRVGAIPIRHQHLAAAMMKLRPMVGQAYWDGPPAVELTRAGQNPAPQAGFCFGHYQLFSFRRCRLLADALAQGCQVDHLAGGATRA